MRSRGFALCGLLLGCGPAPASSFFHESPDLVARLTVDPNAPGAREESWTRKEHPEAWEHCSRVETPVDPRAVDPRLSAEVLGPGRFRASLCQVHGADVADAPRTTFLRTALTQLDFADAHAFLDAHALHPHMILRQWSPEGGGSVLLHVSVEAAALATVVPYLESSALLPRGDRLRTSARPDGSSVTTILEPTATGARVTLAVEQPRNQQLW